MPELPEVETIRRSIAPHTTGLDVRSTYASRKPLRGGSPVDGGRLRNLVGGSVLHQWRRRGKYLLARLSGGTHLLIHLGMTGNLRLASPGSTRAPHTHLVLGLGDSRELHFVDPRRFGQVQVLTAGELAAFEPLARMGPEPLSRTFTGGWLHQRLTGSRRPIKNALMDQELVAGLGNIYVAEALHMARLDPRREAGDLTRRESGQLARQVREVLRQAIHHCGTTLIDYQDGWGVRGRYRQRLRVFGREGEPCRRCHTTIARLVQAGRSTFHCPGCQG